MFVGISYTFRWVTIELESGRFGAQHLLITSELEMLWLAC